MVKSSSTWLLIGTAEHLADKLSALYESNAVDGYNLMFPFLPTDFEVFKRGVVPLLQAKGVFRKEYEPLASIDSVTYDYLARDNSDEIKGLKILARSVRSPCLPYITSIH
ncbi:MULTISPECIES: Luciferase-like, subgroup [Pseudomonas]|uniref:Luciferase-like, subgroup n=1 Tax=Pseudomonas TaxID=286 RepID=UPI0003551167|nr:MULTISPECIES: Luciferase-like, subgroup [Pseudomonas]EPJ91083.1 Luciferase-like, subgroup [Pseudomonas sp. CFII68]OOG87561.1 hypothetical protein B0E42_08250 [Pseudomonas sp. A25(2017)]